ncbi:uncharacterized protein VTP21DRAFT_7262 [Calcarisporiella thermophila]|uniref:uncharacterized protein n=1 Tax=Calcarisporiella thermophila TaxID=911321 RepID=UPI0037426BC0
MLQRLKFKEKLGRGVDFLSALQAQGLEGKRGFFYLAPCTSYSRSGKQHIYYSVQKSGCALLRYRANPNPNLEPATRAPQPLCKREVDRMGKTACQKPLATGQVEVPHWKTGVRSFQSRTLACIGAMSNGATLVEPMSSRRRVAWSSAIAGHWSPAKNSLLHRSLPCIDSDGPWRQAPDAQGNRRTSKKRALACSSPSHATPVAAGWRLNLLLNMAACYMVPRWAEIEPFLVPSSRLTPRWAFWLLSGLVGRRYTASCIIGSIAFEFVRGCTPSAADAIHQRAGLGWRAQFESFIPEWSVVFLHHLPLHDAFQLREFRREFWRGQPQPSLLRTKRRGHGAGRCCRLPGTVYKAAPALALASWLPATCARKSLAKKSKHPHQDWVYLFSASEFFLQFNYLYKPHPQSNLSGVGAMKFFNIAVAICSLAAITQALPSHRLLPRTGDDDSYAIASINQNGVIARFGFKQEPGDEMKVHVVVEQGLKNETQPYHVHVHPVPANGDCNGTGGHLDPKQVNGTDRCNSQSGYQCEVGDLSGKHGPLAGSPEGNLRVDIEYTDPDLTFSGENSVVGRSVVIHRPDNTRLACANITVVDKNTFDKSLPSDDGPNDKDNDDDNGDDNGDDDDDDDDDE